MEKLALSIPGSGGTPIQLEPPVGVPSGGLFDKAGKAGTGINVIGVAIELLIVGAVLLSLYYIIRGGINMMTSGGDKEKFQRGRERVRYAIIGLIIIFMSFFLVNLIGAFFGVDLLQISK